MERCWDILSVVALNLKANTLGKVCAFSKHVLDTGVNKKPKKFKTVWHGFRGILKLSGRVNQASLKLSAGFSNTVC